MYQKIFKRIISIIALVADIVTIIKMIIELFWRNESKLQAISYSHSWL